MSSAADRFRAVRSQIPQHVHLVAVSKTRSIEEILELYALGQRDFGENRALELAAKAEALPKDIRWHLIGQLQTNKVRAVLPYVNMLHSADREKLLFVLQEEAQRLGKTVDVLLERHIAAEESKSGLSRDELLRLLSQFDSGQFSSLRLRGLMGMATFTDDQALICSEFELLRAEFEEFRPGREGFDTLSMGMSSDYQWAIACGSTLVRVGTALFGPRLG
jgi:pyridoxal phosphate enzyme (YggS family)